MSSLTVGLFQDTILALQSLSEFARLAFSKTFDIQLSVTAGTFSKHFSVNRNNALVLQSADVSPAVVCGHGAMSIGCY